MNRKPASWATGLVRILVPPMSREHVLGDLDERIEATRPPHPTLAYLRDASETVPLVIWSGIRRTFDPTLFRAQALVLYFAFISGAFFQFGSGGPAFLNSGHGLWLVAVPTLVALFVLSLADAYTAHRRANQGLHLGLVALAFGVAWLVNSGARLSMLRGSVPNRVFIWGAMLGLGLLPTMRLVWTRRSQNRLAVVDSHPDVDIRTRANRLSERMLRRTRVGYVIMLGLAAAFAREAIIAVNPLQRVGAILTVLSCLYGTSQLRGARPAPLPISRDSSTWLPAYRAELARQRDFHGGRMLWWRLITLVPGYLLFCAGMAVAHPDAAYRPAMIGAAFLLFGLLGIPLNRRLARKYQEQLDALREEPSI